MMATVNLSFRPGTALLLNGEIAEGRDVRMLTFIVRIRFGANDLHLDLGLEEVDGPLEEGGCEPCDGTRGVVVSCCQRARAAIGIGGQPPLSAAERREERSSEEHLSHERRVDTLPVTGNVRSLHLFM